MQIFDPELRPYIKRQHCRAVLTAASAGPCSQPEHFLRIPRPVRSGQYQGKQEQQCRYDADTQQDFSHLI